MILAVVDDLMFTSKIRTTAKPLGVSVVFARSSEAALAEMRKAAPALVIFDLNNPRTDPLGTVVAMKGDPALASIPTVGFVSHVQTDLIERARQAGIDEVMARSAFTTGLAEILRRDSPDVVIATTTPRLPRAHTGTVRRPPRLPVNGSGEL